MVKGGGGGCFRERIGGVGPFRVYVDLLVCGVIRKVLWSIYNELKVSIASCNVERNSCVCVGRGGELNVMKTLPFWQ